jgi:hypothetical protein
LETDIGDSTNYQPLKVTMMLEQLLSPTSENVDEIVSCARTFMRLEGYESFSRLIE